MWSEYMEVFQDYVLYYGWVVCLMEGIKNRLYIMDIILYYGMLKIKLNQNGILLYIILWEYNI